MTLSNISSSLLTLDFDASLGSSSGLSYYYHDFWQETSHPFTGRLPLVDGGPWKLFSILFLYYMFVRHWGPRMMKVKPPFCLLLFTFITFSS